ncbi:hypothetical protein MASR1M74_08350 [Lentimicrobium sp.]
MEIDIIEVSNKKQLRTFINLTAKIHHDDPYWLPPVYADEWNYFNPSKNKGFNHCETILLLAFHQGKAVGRIMGIIHRSYNQLTSERTARFSHFACFNMPEVASALLSNIEKWAINHGADMVAGPYGFSDKDPQGFRIEGFDDLPQLIDIACNHPYMVDLTLANGYSPMIDCMTYRFNIDLVLPDIYKRVQQRVLNGNRFRMHEFTHKKELKKQIVPFLRLVNQTYSNLYGFYPMNEVEMHDLADRYMPVLDPRFIKTVTHNDELVAFIVGVPNMSDGVRRAKGKLLPFGWYHILKSMRNASQLDLMLGAIKPEHQGLGLEICMGMLMLESARVAGIKNIETHLILESNTRMRAVVERIDAKVVKRFRVFQKKPSPGRRNS